MRREKAGCTACKRVVANPDCSPKDTSIMSFTTLFTNQSWDDIKKLIRGELFGEIKRVEKAEGYPEGVVAQAYKLRIESSLIDTTIEARSDESVLVAIERAGIFAPSKCRSGECGYCRSRLISGDVFVPSESDGRRAADKKFGYIHPCASYPLSDLHIQLPD